MPELNSCNELDDYLYCQKNHNYQTSLQNLSPQKTFSFF